jgi:hypothetical protein
LAGKSAGTRRKSRKNSASLTEFSLGSDGRERYQEQHKNQQPVTFGHDVPLRIAAPIIQEVQRKVANQRKNAGARIQQRDAGLAKNAIRCFTIWSTIRVYSDFLQKKKFPLN